jgi:predicted transposase YbfD/YdcC
MSKCPPALTGGDIFGYGSDLLKTVGVESPDTLDEYVTADSTIHAEGYRESRRAADAVPVFDHLPTSLATSACITMAFFSRRYCVAIVDGGAERVEANHGRIEYAPSAHDPVGAWLAVRLANLVATREQLNGKIEAKHTLYLLSRKMTALAVIRAHWTIENNSSGYSTSSLTKYDRKRDAITRLSI